MPSLIHPYYTAAEGLTMADPVDGVSLDTTLRHGISAWVIKPARKRVTVAAGFFDDETSTAGELIGPARFRVAIRRLVPLASPPQLEERDPRVMEWVKAQGWEKAVEALEARFAERVADGSLKRLAAGRNAEEAQEWERRRAEDAIRPSYGDEVVTQAGDVAEWVYDAGKWVIAAPGRAIDAVKKASGSLWTFVKWGAAFGAGALVINAARRNR